jgi:hypothetical protein
MTRELEIKMMVGELGVLLRAHVVVDRREGRRPRRDQREKPRWVPWAANFMRWSRKRRKITEKALQAWLDLFKKRKQVNNMKVLEAMKVRLNRKEQYGVHMGWRERTTLQWWEPAPLTWTRKVRLSLCLSKQTFSFQKNIYEGISFKLMSIHSTFMKEFELN